MIRDDEHNNTINIHGNKIDEVKWAKTEGGKYAAKKVTRNYKYNDM